MHKDTKYLLLVFAIAIPYFWLKFQSKPDVRTLLKPRVFDMDPDGSLTRQYVFYNRLDTLLLNRECTLAHRMIDSAMAERIGITRLLDYKGLAFLCDGDARTSIGWFNQSMEQEGWKYPKALSHRAQAYALLNILDSAIADLKECANLNHEFTKQLGEVYEKENRVDSAIRYYELFLSHYPDSLRIKERINRLK